jgi:hypothetical protein
MGTDIEKPVTKRDLEVALDHAITRMEKFVLDREIGMLWRFLLLGLALLGAQWAAISWVNYPRLKPFFMSMDLVPVNPSPQYPRTKPFRLEDVTRQQIEKIMAAHRSIHPQPKRDANGNVTDFGISREPRANNRLSANPLRLQNRLAHNPPTDKGQLWAANIAP